MPTFTTITNWVKAAQAGEEAAWNFLFQQFYPVLYAEALHFCSPAVAKDAVQETFITAFLKLYQLKNTDTYESWMKKILRHICYRMQRKTKKWSSKEIVNEYKDATFENEWNKKLDSLSTQNRLYASLIRLPEALRGTLLLRYFSAFSSYDDMASILGVPVGTIRSRLNQAKTILSEKWHQPVDVNASAMEEVNEWNQFYYTTFSGMHQHDNHKKSFVHHLQKDVVITFADEQHKRGRGLFEKMVDDDRKFGSFLTPTSIVSCGNISIIESRHFNSPEYPHHCPYGSVLILFRDKETVNKMRFHTTETALT